MGNNSQKSKGSAELPELLTAQEAAEFLHLSPITLSHYRYQGRGPIYRKHGWRVYYTKADLVDWSEGQRWVSTGEPLR
ncbi:MAG: helix-turn-helix domain-containing protein [Hyphomonas sp.]|nr:helix-turn-helix domain-containing protein [Hyphomonas sp.]